MIERRFAVPVLAIIMALAGMFVVVGGDSNAAVTCPPTTLTRTGVQSAGINQANNQGTWDLTGAVWNKTGGTYPVRSDSWTKGCLLGGTVIGQIVRTDTRDQWYDGSGRPYTAEGVRQVLTSPADNYSYIKDTYISDVEDAFDPDGTNSAQMVTLDHVRTEWIRDDCFENEGSVVASMTLNNVLFDGCFTGFAERPSGASTAQDGTGAASLTVDNSLVYISPQPLGSKYCSSTSVSRGRCKVNPAGGWLGSYGIWKWSTAAAKTVVVRNTIFRMDLASYSSCQSQKWPAGTYQNVTLVWTGTGPYSTAGECTNVLPAGVTLTTDVNVWNNARAAWLAGTQPTQSASPSVSPSPSQSPTPTLSTPPTPTATPCQRRHKKWTAIRLTWGRKPCL